VRGISRCSDSLSLVTSAELTPSKLLHEAESLHAQLEALKRQQPQRPFEQLDWKDAIDMHSIELGTETTDQVSHSSSIAPQYNSTAVPSKFTVPTLQSCHCPCECVSVSTCYCRCDLGSTGSGAAASSASGCTCKCFCLQPENWPRSIPYSHQLDWSTASLGSTGSPNFLPSPPHLPVLRDRLSIRPASRFALGPSSLRNSLGVFSLAPIRKGQRNLIDVAGQVRVTDRRSWLGKGRYAEEQWKHIPSQPNSDPPQSSFLVELSPATYDMPFQFDIDMQHIGNETRFLACRSASKSNVRFTSYRDALTGQKRIGLECTREIAIGGELVVDEASRRSEATRTGASASPHRQQEKHKHKRKRGGLETASSTRLDDDDTPLIDLMPTSSTPTPATAAAAASFTSQQPTWIRREVDDHLVCIICQRAYSERASFDYHWNRLHSEAYACSMCNYRGGTALKLQEHESKHRRRDAAAPPTPSSAAAATSAATAAPPAPVDPATTVLNAVASVKAKLDSKKSFDSPASSSKPSSSSATAYTAVEWLQLQEKRARLRATCDITPCVVFGAELRMKPSDAAAQERALELFRRAPGSVLHREKTTAERVWQPVKKEGAATASTREWIIPQQLYAVHDLPPGLPPSTRTPLLRLPILPPSFHFPSSEFRLPAGCTVRQQREDSAEGWGVSMREIRMHQKKKHPSLSAVELSSSDSLKPKRRSRAEPDPVCTGPFVCQVFEMKNAEVMVLPTAEETAAAAAAVSLSPHKRPAVLPSADSLGRVRIVRVMQEHPVNAEGSIVRRQVIGVYVLTIDCCALVNHPRKKFFQWSTEYRHSFRIPPRRGLPLPCRSTLWNSKALLKLCTGQYKMQERERAPAAAWLLQSVVSKMFELEDPELGGQGDETRVWEGRTEENPMWQRVRQTTAPAVEVDGIPAVVLATATPPGAIDDDETEDEERELPSSQTASEAPSEDEQQAPQARGPPQSHPADEDEAAENSGEEDDELPELIHISSTSSNPFPPSLQNFFEPQRVPAVAFGVPAATVLSAVQPMEIDE
jgi:hypothetical protein